MHHADLIEDLAICLKASEINCNQLWPYSTDLLLSRLNPCRIHRNLMEEVREYFNLQTGYILPNRHLTQLTSTNKTGAPAAWPVDRRMAGLTPN